MSITKNARTEEISGTASTLDLSASNAGLAAASGQLVQQVHGESATYQTLSTAFVIDDTIPQNTEGDEITTVAITPTKVGNKLIIVMNAKLAHDNAGAATVGFALFKDSDANALGANCLQTDSGALGSLTLTHEFTVVSATSQTFKMRGGTNAGTGYSNGNAGGRFFGGVSIADITIFEVDPTALSPATPGLLLQHVYAEDRTHQTITTEIPIDDTIPQQTEGSEVMTVTITPTSAASILEVTAELSVTTSGSNFNVLAMFQDATAGAVEALCFAYTGADFCDVLTIQHRVVAGSTSPTTFKLRLGVAPGSSATVYTNGTSSGRRLGGVQKSYMQVKELIP